MRMYTGQMQSALKNNNQREKSSKTHSGRTLLFICFYYRSINYKRVVKSDHCLRTVVTIRSELNWPRLCKDIKSTLPAEGRPLGSLTLQGWDKDHPANKKLLTLKEKAVNVSNPGKRGMMNAFPSKNDLKVTCGCGRRILRCTVRHNRFCIDHFFWPKEGGSIVSIIHHRGNCKQFLKVFCR